MFLNWFGYDAQVKNLHLTLSYHQFCHEVRKIRGAQRCYKKLKIKKQIGKASFVIFL
jgi:hypothetical protein